MCESLQWNKHRQCREKGENEGAEQCSKTYFEALLPCVGKKKEDKLVDLEVGDYCIDLLKIA